MRDRSPPANTKGRLLAAAMGRAEVSVAEQPIHQIPASTPSSRVAQIGTAQLPAFQFAEQKRTADKLAYLE